MKGLTPKKMAAACGGQYYGPKEIADTEVTAVTTDSRKVTKGCLFVPLKGTRSDGHDYIPQVMKDGALVTLTERREAAAGYPNIQVESTADAIQKIAGLYRRELDIPVVGITGSVGKTSTKEMIAAVLSQKYRVLKTAGNFNNNLGLPLTIFRLTPEDEIAVLEMGISHFGEMEKLAETANPDTMVITNIGTCHLEFLKDRDGVFKAKTECFDYVKYTGSVILNGEDDKLIQVKDVHGKQPIFYGLSPRFRVYADNIKPLGLKGISCTINIDDDSFDVTVPLPGIHMVMNALAGAAVGAEEQHVVGIGRCCRLGEDRTELVVDDLLVVQALVKRFDPVHGGEGGPAQRREERDHDERDDALADSLARGALVVALYVVPAVFGAVKLFCHGPSSRS